MTNMNDFVVIENPQRPPSVYKHVTPINAFFNIRSANIADEIVRFADVTVDIGRRKIMRGDEVVKLTRASIIFCWSLFKMSIVR